MADPSVRSVGTRRTNANVLAPPTVVAGDLILVEVGSPLTSSIGITGFTYLPVWTTTRQGAFLWKIADATDVSLSVSAGNYTLTGASGGPQVAYAIQDVDQASPIRDSAGSYNTANSTTTDALSLSSLTAGDLLMWFVAEPVGSSAFALGTPLPTGSTRLFATSNSTLHAVSVSQASAGASISFVGNNLTVNGRYVVGLVAIKADTSSHIPVAADFTGEGALSATATPHFAVTVAAAATGTLTAVIASRPAIAGSFNGAGALSGIVRPLVATSASFAGAGTLSATVVPHLAVTVSAAGEGTLSAAVRPRITVATASTGDGTLTAVVRRGALHINLTGNGAMTAVIVTRPAVSASSAGTGTLTGITTSRVRLADTGTRVSPPLDLSNIIDVTTSSVNWDADLPADTSMTVETSIDGGGTWQTATNGGTIPGITTGLDCTGLTVQSRVTLNGDGFATPDVHSLSLTVTQAKVSHFENSGVPDNNRFNLGVYILTTPDRPVGETPTTYQVQGYDKLYLLTHEVGDTYTVGTGTGFLSAVRQAITDSGYTGLPPLIDSTLQGKALQAPMVWHGTVTPTTWLRVINDLLASIGYRGLWVDADGRFRSEPYQRPQDRAPEWVFDMTDEHTDIVSEDRTYKQDAFEQLNWWLFIRDASPTTPTEGDGLYTIDRTNGASRRPKVVKLTAADQASLESQGDQIFTQDTQRTSSWDIKTGPLPVLGHFDVMTITDPELGDFKVQSSGHSIPLDGSDVTLTLEVVS